MRLLKQIQGHLYHAATEGTALTLPTDEDPVEWDKLDHGQKALACVESELHVLFKVYEMDMSWKNAKKLSGFGSKVYTQQEEREMATHIAAEDKTLKKLKKGDKPKPFDKSKDNSWKQNKWGKTKEQEDTGDKTTTGPDALKTFSKRVTQLEAALNKGGHVTGAAGNDHKPKF